MTRLADRLLRGCEPARVSAMVGPASVEKFARERIFEELDRDTTPQGFEKRVSEQVRRFRQIEPVSTRRFDPEALAGAPIFVGDDVAAYVDSLPDGIDFVDIVASMAPPFDRFFVEFQGVPNKAEVFAWGALVTAHDYSQEFGQFPEDDGTPRWILRMDSYLEREKERPVGPVATHMAGLAEDGTWFRHDDGAVWWGGGCPGMFQPEPPPEVMKDWGDNIAQLLFPALLTISFLHCKNIELREVRPPERLSRKHRKKHGRELN